MGLVQRIRRIEEIHMMNSENNAAVEVSRRKRRNRRILWTFVAMWVMVVLAPIPGYFMTTDTLQAKGEFTDNPRSAYWGEVRRGGSGYTTDKGLEAGNLVNDGGEIWRVLRSDIILPYGAWLIALAIVAIGGLIGFVGTQKIEGELSGTKIKRWNSYDICMHWVVAVTFFIMSISGLILLYGRAVLIPLFGREGFAGLAMLCKDVHNLLGIPFSVALVMMILPWLKDNMFRSEDSEWLANAGGMFDGSHPSSGKNNAGEKIWFWMLAIGGTVLIVSGVILVMPNLEPLRSTMISMHILHSVSGLILIAVSLGHSYMGSFGVEGALDGMLTGEVDAAWAKQHHDLWYAEQMGEEAPANEKSAQSSTTGPAGLSTGKVSAS